MRPLKKYLNATDTILKKKKKDRQTTEMIALNSSEFPMKTLGLSLASISPGATWGWGGEERLGKYGARAPFANTAHPLGLFNAITFQAGRTKR